MVQEGGGHADAGGPQGMADGDGAAPGVEAGAVGQELAGPHQGDGGEGLVALDGVELLDVHAGPGEQLAGDGVGRREHEDRVLGTDGEVHEAGAGRETQLVGRLPAGDQHGRRAVGHLRGVAGGDVGRRIGLPALRRGQLGQGLEAGVGPNALVVVEGLARDVALGVLERDGDDLLGEVARLGGLVGPPVALEGVLVHVLTADLPAFGEDLGDAELHPQLAVDDAEKVLAEGALAALGVRGHRRARHRFDTACDGEVVVAGLDAGGHEVHRLLGRSALAVDGGRRHLPREARSDPRVAGDVASLLARLGDAAADDVVDPFGVDAGALEQALQGEAEQVGGVPRAQRPLALAEGRTDDIDDDGFSRIGRCHSLTR